MDSKKRHLQDTVYLRTGLVYKQHFHSRARNRDADEQQWPPACRGASFSDPWSLDTGTQPLQVLSIAEEKEREGQKKQERPWMN